MRGTDQYQDVIRLDPEERDYLDRLLAERPGVLIDPFVGPARRILEKLRGER